MSSNDDLSSGDEGEVPSLEELKSLRDRSNWEKQIEYETIECFDELRKLLRIGRWKGQQLPNLRDIFTPRQIERILTEDFRYGENYGYSRLARFVFATGYRDQPELDKDGRPLLQSRRTPVHESFSWEHEEESWDRRESRQLLKIYDRYDATYVDERGLTHLHVASRYGFVDIVEKLLEAGHDPNCLTATAESRDSPAQLALAYSKIEALETLLRAGADPNLADAEGSTLLHNMCKRGDDLGEVDDAEALARSMFEIGAENENLPAVRVDGLDGSGSAALHLSVGRRGLVELLLRNGADPNVADADGFTTLHRIYELDPNFAERFFQICDDIGREVRVDARDKLGRTALHMARDKTVAELLLRRGADPNAANEEGSTLLHLLCRDNEDKYSDLAKSLLEVSQEIGRPALVDARDKKGRSPLHLALDGPRKDRTVDWLLRRAGADPSSLDSEGRTLLHVICGRDKGYCRDDNDDDLVDVFFEIVGEVGLMVPAVDAQDERGNTPLHLALGRDRTKVVESLLRRGANPNLANAEGSTPLHVICRENSNPPHGVKIVDVAQRFFDVSDDVGRPVDVDARDSKGNTPWHLVLQSSSSDIKTMTELLLRRGPDVNLANEAGSTPLHVICKKNRCGAELIEMIFKDCDERHRTIRIDAQDNEGNTPLCLALIEEDYFVRMTPLLLRRGANPNLANAEGLTPLHIICKRTYNRDNAAKVFFEINDERSQTVDVNARDNSGRTPLQWAVHNLLPNAVEQLLDHGADLASFVFPTQDYSDERFSKEINARYWRYDSLGAAINALAVIERLENRGYQLDRSDALRFMKFFAEQEMFGRETESWMFYSRFRDSGENIMIIPDMSLYDLLTKLRPEEAAKLLTLSDFARLLQSQTFKKYLKWHNMHDSFTKLSEILLGGFCRRWALDPFWELIHQRLPLECCDMIMDHLMNKDLWNICLAATGQSS
ncbi:unnamed protein product [Trichogramma brassicae]|uniref:Uncharacterized protein n=1 Tax=Trichogramma brassicae TaxID=86971 RepID=A0A6H5HXH9_9HYME|nr:unnamed protein product [Trichogramma brassicae]